LLRGVRLTVVEDKPQRGDVVLVDRLGNAIEDLLGWAEEAVSAAIEAEQAVAHPLDTHRARQSLTLCQERFAHLAREHLDLTSYERMAELMRFGRGRRGEWQAWTRSVRQALEECQPPLEDVNRALFRCWQEIAERLQTSSVSIHNTTIGQQISASELADKDWPREGIT
jgi:hypothetical protein